MYPEQFKKLFCEWIRSIQPQISNHVIAIDGKSSRHSFDDGNSMLHMISAFATEERLVLAQEKVSAKSNEIEAIPKLLEWLDIKGSTVTIDAMGCQHAIANKIINKQDQYIFSLKGNQASLEYDVRKYFSDQSTWSKLKSFQDWDKGHGRIESRTCWVETNVEWLKERHPQWDSINSIIRIDSTRQIKDKQTKETRYYIAYFIETPEKAFKKRYVVIRLLEIHYTGF